MKYGLITAAALALAATPAVAMPGAAPGALRGALAEQNQIDNVHCIPGYVHWHPWGWGTGCYRSAPSYFYGPRVYLGPRRHYGGGPRFYGGGPRFYAGPRFHGGGGPRMHYRGGGGHRWR